MGVTIDSRPRDLGSAKAWAHWPDSCFSSVGGCLGLGDGKSPSTFLIYFVQAEIVLVLTRVKIRTRNYNRNSPPADPTDWDEPRFAWIFILFMLNWVFSVSATVQDSWEAIVILSGLTVNF